MSDGARTLYIKFYSGVDYNSANTLMTIVDQKVKEGYSRAKILISSGGGSVFHGLSVFNYLVGLPLEVTTHNFGSVDSVSCVPFCAGSKRYSVPNARFLLHGVQHTIAQPTILEEKQSEERLKGLRIDTENIARVIATTTAIRCRTGHNFPATVNGLSPSTHERQQNLEVMPPVENVLRGD